MDPAALSGRFFYAVSAGGFGYAIDEAGAGVIIPCFVVLCVICCFMIPEAPVSTVGQNKTQQVGPSSFRHTIGTLVHNRDYMLLLVSYTLIEMSSIPIQNYLTRKFEVIGAGDFYVGLSLLVMGAMQLPALLNIERIQKYFNTHTLLKISFCGVMLCSIIIAFGSTPIIIVCAFLTEIFAFGLYIGTILVYMRSIVPSTILLTGMTIYSALSSGLGGIVGNYLAGFSSRQVGIDSMMEILLIPGIVGLLLFLGISKKDEAKLGSVTG